MKKLSYALCILLALQFSTSCAYAPIPSSIQPADFDPEIVISVDDPEIIATSATTADESDEERAPKIYEPQSDMTIEDVITAYFEQQYIAYTDFEYIDLSAIVDTTKKVNVNMMRWHEMLIQRRRMLFENDFCYVETEKFPYTIEYSDESEDDRMEFWNEWLTDTGNEVVHFRIKGEPGKAYPPIMAINSQHSIFFSKIDGVWKITLHYFPGSVRKFTRAGNIHVPSEAAMLKQLIAEFDPEESLNATTSPSTIPEDHILYDSEKASEYAFRYTETENPDFYRIIDWVGNCANFVSQCVSAGFGGGTSAMTADWNGSDGGTPAWENVNHFWDYITSGQKLFGQQLSGVCELKNGDIVQTRAATSGEEDRFTHMLIVADEDTLLLAQNTPACFVYYSDLVNVESRMIRPTFLAN